MISKLVSCCTRIKPNEQCVVSCFISDREIAIIGQYLYPADVVLRIFEEFASVDESFPSQAKTLR